MSHYEGHCYGDCTSGVVYSMNERPNGVSPWQPYPPTSAFSVICTVHTLHTHIQQPDTQLQLNWI